MKARFFTVSVLFVLALPWVAAGAGRTLYVRSAVMPVKAGAAFDSETLETLHRGDAVKAVGREGDWFRIERRGRTGYVHRLGVSDRAPAGEPGVFTGDTPSVTPSARRRASAMTSAAAARGLTGDSASSLSDPTPANYRALEEIESVAGKITEQDVEHFQARDR